MRQYNISNDENIKKDTENIQDCKSIKSLENIKTTLYQKQSKEMKIDTTLKKNYLNSDHYEINNEDSLSHC